MSTILIAFSSHHGQTEKVANRLGAHLRGMGHEVDLVNLEVAKDGPPPEDYDLVVLGTRIEIGKHAPSLARYAGEHRRALAEMPTALFVVSMAAASTDRGPDPDGYVAKTCAELGLDPARRIAIAGALKYRSYGLVTRLVMKLISRRAGRTTDTSRDHEFTDWTVVRRFAESLAGLCPHDTAILSQL